MLESVLRLYGVPVHPDDARALIATLLATDNQAAAEAAETIKYGVETDAALLVLAPHERDAILAALEDPRAGLAELRAMLLGEREREQRHGPDLDA